MARKKKSDIQSDIDTIFADNVSGDINEADLRAVFSTVIDSMRPEVTITTTFTTGLQLLNTDATFQGLDPEGTGKDVLLPADEADLRFIIKNVNDDNSASRIVVKDFGGIVLAELYQHQTIELFCDGTDWFGLMAPIGFHHVNEATTLGSDVRGGDLTNATIIGHGSRVLSGSCSAFGQNAHADAANSLALGVDAQALAAQSIALGNNSRANGSNSLALGRSASSAVEGVSVGREASSGADGVSIGRSALGAGSNVVIGSGATSNTAQQGICIGRDTLNTQVLTICIGHEASVTHVRSIALGARSASKRVGEIINAIDAQTDSNFLRGQVGFSGTTTSISATELFCGGLASNRLGISISSILTFTAHIVGRDNITGDCCAYRLHGAIKRDASDNTVLIGSVTEEFGIEDDAAYAVSITADDTNESLKVEVTAATTNSTQWSVNIEFIETVF